VGGLAELRKATVSFVVPVCQSARNSSALTAKNFMKFNMEALFENLPRKFKCH